MLIPDVYDENTGIPIIPIVIYNNVINNPSNLLNKPFTINIINNDKDIGMGPIYIDIGDIIQTNEVNAAIMTSFFILLFIIQSNLSYFT